MNEKIVKATYNLKPRSTYFIYLSRCMVADGASCMGHAAGAGLGGGDC
jgi:hypothetical protein